MMDFRIGTLPSSSVLHIYSLREYIWFDPPYQRQSDIWPLSKRQLLIDTIINGYDVPKLYFHEFYPAKEHDGRKFKYAIIDGKQRLKAIFDFIEGRFPLGDGMEYIADSDVRAGGLTYAELARQYPDLKTRLDGFSLPIMAVMTDEMELIEDMFSRLNEAIPLNAAEKRNAFGGPIPGAIRDLVRRDFFIFKLPFNNKRYRHFDLAAKFLYLSHRGQLIETKKSSLDEFVRNFAEERKQEEAQKLNAQVLEIIGQMSNVFVESDALLKSVGSVVLYYYLFLEAHRHGWTIERSDIAEFERIRAENRAAAEAEEASQFELLEYDRLAQSPNDGAALKYRFSILRKYVGPKENRP